MAADAQQEDSNSIRSGSSSSRVLQMRKCSNGADSKMYRWTAAATAAAGMAAELPAAAADVHVFSAFNDVYGSTNSSLQGLLLPVLLVKQTAKTSRSCCS